MPSLTLKGEFITLAQALKVSSLVESGGNAKQLIRSGEVLVNGAVEVKPGCKLRAGDRFSTAESDEEWTIVPEE